MTLNHSAREVRTRGLASCLLTTALLFVFLTPAATPQQRKQAVRRQRISPDLQTALNSISADSLRGHLSFLASDALEGRATPSRGQDIAAEYIAAQFRRAGLEPAGDEGADDQKSYFQVADWRVLETDAAAFSLTLQDGPQSFNVPVTAVSFAGDQPINLKSAPLLKVDYKSALNDGALKAEQVNGKVILTEIPDFRTQEQSKWGALFKAQLDFVNRLKSLGALLVVSIDRSSTVGRGVGGRRLIDPARPGGGGRGGGPGSLFLTLHEPKAALLYDVLPLGEPQGSITLQLEAPVERPAKLRNVAGLLRGSDPVLKDTYVVVSAHYDHIGIDAPINGDAIYNGANDDGSGTVSVIELASALSRLKIRPKRSLLFITWFGEERGLLGSRYYGRHPLFPLDKTIAMVNLEQVGRSDGPSGPQLNSASMTGFDFTDMGPIFKAAGEKTGVRVYKDEENSDDYFARSDNQALADAGVPAHTLCTLFEFADYHQPGDTWEKVDYDNMARVDRMIALALATIANNASPPKWNEANPKTQKYVQVWKALHKD